MMQLVAGRGIYDEDGVAVAAGTVLDGQVAYGKLQGGKWSIWEYRYDYAGSLSIQGYVSLIYRDPDEVEFDPYSYAPQDTDQITKVQTDVTFIRESATGKEGSHHGVTIPVACSGMHRLSKIFFEPTTSTWAAGTGTIIVNHINDRSGT